MPRDLLREGQGSQQSVNVALPSSAPWFAITDDLPQFATFPHSRPRRAWTCALTGALLHRTPSGRGCAPDQESGRINFCSGCPSVPTCRQALVLV